MTTGLPSAHLGNSTERLQRVLRHLNPPCHYKEAGFQRPLRPCIKIITRRDRPAPLPRAHLGRGAGVGSGGGAFPPRSDPVGRGMGRGPRPAGTEAAAAGAPGQGRRPSREPERSRGGKHRPGRSRAEGALSVRLRSRQERVSRRGGGAGRREVPAVLLKERRSPGAGPKPIAKNTYYTATFCK